MIVEQARRQIEQELQATRTEIERLDELLKLKGDYDASDLAIRLGIL